MESFEHKPLPTTEHEATALIGSGNKHSWNIKVAKIAAVTVAVIASALVIAAASPSMEGHTPPCVDIGPPYLLATMHGGGGNHAVNNVVKFSRNGCTMSTGVLEKSKDVSLRELRGLAVLPSGNLVVLNAYRLNSQVLLYGSCSEEDHATRPFTGHALDAEAKDQEHDDDKENDAGDDTGDPMLVHPYGVTANADASRVFVSNQDTCSISALATGEVEEVIGNERVVFGPCSRRESDHDHNRDDDKKDMSKIRGVALDAAGLLYVADQQKGLVVYNMTTSQMLGSTTCYQCIGVYYDKASDSIFSGSESKNEVYQIAPWPSLERVATLGKDSGGLLSHPAGLAAHNNTLFVVSQDKRLVLKFDIPTGHYQGIAVAHTLDNDMEGLILSPC
mmetsp:Transcript_14189/g.29104  ORF Transcript_14189/g.29104 Transcript_14189/m.29104 type:complete len:390 (+) Transcript_14189:67-1236(+)